MKRLIPFGLAAILLAGCRTQHRDLELARDYDTAHRAAFTPLGFPYGLGAMAKDGLTRPHEPPSPTQRFYSEPEPRELCRRLIDRLEDHRLPAAQVTHGDTPRYFDPGLNEEDLVEITQSLAQLSGVNVVGECTQRRAANWIVKWQELEGIAARYPAPHEPLPKHRVP